MMNHRLTFAASIAVLAAALSLHSLLTGGKWYIASIGAVAVVALAGTLTRMATVHAAIAASAAALVGIVPVLAGYSWPGLILAVVVVAITAAGATGLRAPRVLGVLVTYFGLELIYLSMVFATSSSLGGVLPTRNSVDSLAKLPNGISGQFKFYPPITAIKQVEFVTVAGVALIAICVDLLAVRLRRPALAGLPLLLLFSVPVASSLKNFGIVQTLLFGVAISAYLALLSVDGRQRLRMWGRLVTIRRTLSGEDAGQGPDTRQLAASGRRVGLTAVGVAMVVPLILAGGTPKDLFGKTATGGGGGGLGFGTGGLAPLTAVGKNLLSKPRQVLTYITNSGNPSTQYLQEYVLNYFDTKWQLFGSEGKVVQSDQLSDPVPGLAPGFPTDTVTTTVSLDTDPGYALPLPYAPTKIITSNPFFRETVGTLMVFNEVSSSQYTVISREATPKTSAELSTSTKYPAAIVADYGGYTGPDRSQLLAIARRETKGAKTPFEEAFDLQNWFNSSHFSYSVRESWPASGPWVLKFLTHDPRGDCTQFAPAFAVLARLLGIPSRVAVGYTAGTKVAGGTYKVTTADAHAWPELYFLQAGWIRFEPTPSGAGDQGTATAPTYTQSSSSGANGSKAIVPPVSSPSTGPLGKAGKGNNSKLKQLNDLAAGGDSLQRGGGSGFPVGITLLAVLLALLASPGLARWVTTRRRWMTASGDAARASTAWRELLDYLSDYGIEWFPSESPRAIATRITETVGLRPADAAAIARIGSAEERSRYARAAVPGAGLRADVAAVRRALAASTTRLGRLRARLLPASTLSTARRGLQSANRVFSWLDSPLPSMRRDPRRSAPHQAS
jgi:transglutaminase-like putative cysteine protease